MMKKVAIISSTYAPSLWSGLGRHTFYLAYALAERSYDVSVFTFAPSGKSFRTQDGQVSISRISVSADVPSGTPLPAESLEEWNTLVRAELKKKHFDYILLPTCHGWMAAKDSASPILGFVPFVYGFTGWISSVAPEKEKAMLALEKDFLENCSELVCHNEQFGKRVAAYANRNVFILPNAHLDVSEDTLPSVEKVLNSILFVGKINKEKSVETVVRAIVDVPDAILSLCYPEVADRYVPKITALATSLGIENRVKLLGWRASNEVKSLYAQSEISVTTSHHEPYGYSVLDSMAMRSIPLVADWSGLSSYVTEEETFSSIDSMSKAIRNILGKSPEDKRAMESHNLQKILTTYSSKQTTDTLEQILRGML